MFKEQPGLTINSLLSRLDEWRFFPKFQLERHFDVILSFILPDLLAEYERESKIFRNQKIEVTPECIAKAHLIPEFPLPLRLFNRQVDHYQAIAVDFALFIPHKNLDRTKHVLFVELKTDETSARDTQNEYLKKLQNHNIGFNKGHFDEIVSEIIQMILKSENPRKYLYLLHNFSKLELTKPLDDMFVSFLINTSRFDKSKYLSSEDTVPDLSHINYSSLVIAPQSVTEKLNHETDLPIFDFNTAENLLEKLNNPSTSEVLSHLRYCFSEWNSSPTTRIKNKDFFHSLTSKRND